MLVDYREQPRRALKFVGAVDRRLIDVRFDVRPIRVLAPGGTPSFATLLRVSRINSGRSSTQAGPRHMRIELQRGPHRRMSKNRGHNVGRYPPSTMIVAAVCRRLWNVALANVREAWIAHGAAQGWSVFFIVMGWVLATAVVLSLTGLLKRD